MSADSRGDIFDPEIHATDKEGNPSFNKDGSFRKKRKDAGRKGAAAEAKPVSSAGKAMADQRQQYAKATAGVLQPIAAMLTLVDPVDGYCAGQLVPGWSEVVADLAMEYPQVAAALDKVAVVGPLSGAIGMGLLTFMQFGHNHGKVPAHLASMFGATPRTQVEQMLKQRGAQMAAEAEERQRQDAEEAAEAEAIQRLVEEGRKGGPREHVYADTSV